MANLASIVAAANRHSSPRPIANVRDIRANFCGMRDAKGRIIFDPYIISAGSHEWLEQKRAAGLTHVVMCPVANYPGMPMPSVDLRSEPESFAVYVSFVLNQGFVPFIMLTTGDGGSAEDIDRYWPGLLSALKPYEQQIVVCPGFELVGPGGGWTSAELSRGLLAIHAALPNAVLAVHLQPERATGASHPVEPDDPWQGDESGFWWSHGGEFVDLFCYQTPHGSKLLEGDGWEDRWREIVERLGIGARGWRQVPLCWFEVIAYDFVHGNCGAEAARPLRERAQAICRQFGIDCTWGNG